MTRKELKQLIREVIEEMEIPQKFVVDGKQVDIESIDIADVDPRDYPDFSDAYISYATFEDGTELDARQIEQLDNMASRWMYQKIWDDELYRR